MSFCSLPFYRMARIQGSAPRLSGSKPDVLLLHHTHRLPWAGVAPTIADVTSIPTFVSQHKKRAGLVSQYRLTSSQDLPLHRFFSSSSQLSWQPVCKQANRLTHRQRSCIDFDRRTEKILRTRKEPPLRTALDANTIAPHFVLVNEINVQFRLF